jgi:hypothetical protein
MLYICHHGDPASSTLAHRCKRQQPQASAPQVAPALSSPNRRRPASLLKTSDTRAHSDEMATCGAVQVSAQLLCGFYQR